uniref:Apyrase n=1 Tax=Romanomermis culicivorax TaxID=13658 RepID=A0A915IUE8_ROMCU
MKHRFILLLTHFSFVWFLFLSSNCNATTSATDCSTLGQYYAIVFDAGSSGTRIYVLEFKSPTKANSASQLKFVNQTFIEGLYSLSSCRDDLKKISALLEPLLKKAQILIPKKLWHETPAAVMATAGLRLLEKNESDAIINEAQNILYYSPFRVFDNSISIISGEQEAYYGWFTVNHLMDRLSPLVQTNAILGRAYVTSTVATIFMGGGSMQVAFLPQSTSVGRKAPKGSLQWFKVFNRMRQLYTVSYLGNGLVQSRLDSLKLKNGFDTKDFTSTCFPADTKFEWKHEKVLYNVEGQKNASFDACLAEQSDFVRKSKIYKPAGELRRANIFLSGHLATFLSEIFDLGSHGGNLTIKEMKDKANETCSITTSFGIKEKALWKCRDLSYIVAVLRALNLRENKQYLISDKIKSMKVRWALGAAYQLLEKRFEEEEIDHCY